MPKPLAIERPAKNKKKTRRKTEKLHSLPNIVKVPEYSTQPDRNRAKKNPPKKNVPDKQETELSHEQQKKRTGSPSLECSFFLFSSLHK